MVPAWIAPSILSADFARLGAEVDAVLEAGADLINFDAMDNHYVPNLTVGPMVCKALKPYCKNTPIDVHLMVKPVDRLIHECARSGANIITSHIEATSNIKQSRKLIKDYGLKGGI